MFELFKSRVDLEKGHEQSLSLRFTERKFCANVTQQVFLISGNICSQKQHSLVIVLIKNIFSYVFSSLKQTFENAMHKLSKMNEQVFIYLDGLDQLESNKQISAVDWVPQNIPKVGFFVSSFGWSSIHISKSSIVKICRYKIPWCQ